MNTARHGGASAPAYARGHQPPPTHSRAAWRAHSAGGWAA